MFICQLNIGKFAIFWCLLKFPPLRMQEEATIHVPQKLTMFFHNDEDVIGNKVVGIVLAIY